MMAVVVVAVVVVSQRQEQQQNGIQNCGPSVDPGHPRNWRARDVSDMRRRLNKSVKNSGAASYRGELRWEAMYPPTPPPTMTCLFGSFTSTTKIEYCQHVWKRYVPTASPQV